MQEPGYSAPIPSPTGDAYAPTGFGTGGNDSGTGPAARLPAELQGFNVGALFLNWIWSIANQTWIGLVCLVPCVGFFMAIYLGIKGNEMAWQNRKWDSIEQFKATQKIWMYWGIGIFCIGVVFQILSVLMGGMASIMQHR